MIQRLFDVDEEEVGGLLWSFLFFFTLLCAYSVLKPVRDEMAVTGDVRKLQWLFTATFAGMLIAVPAFSAVAARMPRRRFVPYLYRFVAVTLAGFFALWAWGVGQVWVARAFFVFASVMNLFIVSVFWAFMADVFRAAQGKRLFGVIAAGGTLGALAGPLLTAALAPRFGPAPMLLLSAVLFEVAVRCMRRVDRWAQRHPVHAGHPEVEQAPVGGSAFSGLFVLARSPFLLGVGAQTLLYAVTSTILYAHYLALVQGAVSDSGERTALFGYVEAGVNALALALQLLVSGRVLRHLGLTVALALLPALTAAGFLGLAAAPALWLAVAFYGLRRSAHYAIERPAREVLFTSVAREARYKSKSFIDTVVYRGGDAASGWLNAGLLALGMGTAGASLAAIPLALAWWAVAVYLGRRQPALAVVEGSA